MPGKFELCVTFENSAGDGWTAVGSTLQELSPNGNLIPLITQPFFAAKDPPRFMIEGLEDGPRYVFTVYYEAAGEKADQDRKLMYTLTDAASENKKQIDKLRKEYKDKATKAASRTNTEGLITFSSKVL